MAVDNLQTLDIIEVMENFLDNRRPPEHIRPQLDIGYKIEGQSTYVFEIRPQWNKPEIIHECPIAKATYVMTKKHWEIFWMRSDLKWHRYTPQPVVKTLKEFAKTVDEDTHHCFWG